MERHELNELNFARFDAKLEQRLAELDAKWGGRWTQLDTKVEQGLTNLGAALRTEFAQGLSQLKGDLLTSMFHFWVPTAATVVGIALGVVALLFRH